jgi:Fe2+ or Zn2+ uptake regulation protein
MARPIDKDVRDRILELIKRECIKQNGPAYLTLVEIALGVGLARTRTEKVFRILKMLQRSGCIHIHNGGGSKPNRYEYLREDIRSAMIEANEETDKELQDILDQFTNASSQFYSYCGSLKKQNVALRGEIEYYKSILRSLRFDGNTPEMHQRFVMAEKGVNLCSIIESLKKEKPFITGNLFTDVVDNIALTKAK